MTENTHAPDRQPPTASISTTPGIRSAAGWIGCADVALQNAFLDELSEEEILALPYLFEFWALDHQLPPAGDWRAWVILGGRGAGKTRAGAEWVRAQVEGARPLDKGRCQRLAIVGETLDQAREVMVFGESGILACSPPDRRPDWIASRRLLRWPNGAEAQIFSAHDPESLRGPQFDGAWVDELAKWPKAQDTWDMLQFGLRLGEQPQVCVTTTPRNVPVLKDLLRRDSTVVTHAATSANRANLADSFLEEVEARYAGTRLGRQELAGELLEEEEGALWSIGGLERLQVEQVPDLDRIVVAVDPAVTATDRSDTCGIIVVGAVMRGPVQDWRAYVLEDASCPAASPSEWAGQAVAMMRNWDADRLVAEVNQGGDLVESVVRQIDPSVPFTKCHASRSKSARAEPVAALYEQGRVFHARGLGLLEDQMCAMTTRGYMGAGSPDRVDALVWALTNLLLEPLRNQRQPQLRAL